jgi:hypothetical protein
MASSSSSSRIPDSKDIIPELLQTALDNKKENFSSKTLAERGRAIQARYESATQSLYERANRNEVEAQEALGFLASGFTVQNFNRMSTDKTLFPKPYRINFSIEFDEIINLYWEYLCCDELFLDKAEATEWYKRAATFRIAEYQQAEQALKKAMAEPDTTEGLIELELNVTDAKEKNMESSAFLTFVRNRRIADEIDSVITKSAAANWLQHVINKLKCAPSALHFYAAIAQLAHSKLADAKEECKPNLLLAEKNLLLASKTQFAPACFLLGILYFEDPSKTGEALTLLQQASPRLAEASLYSIDTEEKRKRMDPNGFTDIYYEPAEVKSLLKNTHFKKNKTNAEIHLRLAHINTDKKVLLAHAKSAALRGHPSAFDLVIHYQEENAAIIQWYSRAAIAHQYQNDPRHYALKVMRYQRAIITQYTKSTARFAVWRNRPTVEDLFYARIAFGTTNLNPAPQLISNDFHACVIKNPAAFLNFASRVGLRTPANYLMLSTRTSAGYSAPDPLYSSLTAVQNAYFSVLLPIPIPTVLTYIIADYAGDVPSPDSTSERAFWNVFCNQLQHQLHLYKTAVEHLDYQLTEAGAYIAHTLDHQKIAFISHEDKEALNILYMENHYHQWNNPEAKESRDSAKAFYPTQLKLWKERHRKLRGNKEHLHKEIASEIRACIASATFMTYPGYTYVRATQQVLNSIYQMKREITPLIQRGLFSEARFNEFFDRPVNAVKRGMPGLR